MIKEDIGYKDATGEEQVIEVELDAAIIWENGSFYYEYGNICATEQKGSYPVIEYTWKQDLYSEAENKAIAGYIENNSKQLEDQFLKQ